MESMIQNLTATQRYYARILCGPLVLLLFSLLPPPEGMAFNSWLTFGLAGWMFLWWIFEAAPLAVTGLLPLVLFPVLGIMDFKQTAEPYANPVIFLFLGGFMLAIAFQKWNLHIRLALWIVGKVGTSAERMVGGFICAASFISMWISNTAAVLMMLPLTLAVIDLLVKNDPHKAEHKRFAKAMLLGICYAVSIGGLGTLIGTPPNAFFKGFMTTQYDYSIGFLDWMLMGVPVVIGLSFGCWFLLVKVFFPVRDISPAYTKKAFDTARKKLKPITPAEKRVAWVAFITAMGWVFSSQIEAKFPKITDSVIAILGAVTLFVIPSDHKKFKPLLTWDDAVQLPWGVLLIFGGGLALSEGLSSTGTNEWIGQSMMQFQHYNIHAIVIAVSFVVLGMTEMISNIATVAMSVPLLSTVASGLGENPLLLALPATMIASLGFMMPISTAANAIVFSTGFVTIKDMVKVGFFLNLIGILVILLALYGIGLHVFDIVPGMVPEWALPPSKTV
ncbi:MAG: SLC13/DASS family transporter [Proteobacteria bacterium]|nr:SLC13/DASS family transporter [Pseudomonadota bacterium]